MADTELLAEPVTIGRGHSIVGPLEDAEMIAGSSEPGDRDLFTGTLRIFCPVTCDPGEWSWGLWTRRSTPNADETEISCSDCDLTEETDQLGGMEVIWS